MNRIRTSGLYDASRWGVTLIGLGGIGSNLAIQLGKMGFNPITIIDGDKVAEENVGTQLYRQSDIYDWKTASIFDRLSEYAPDIEVLTRTTLVDEDTPWFELQAPIIISAVDSISARKDIWRALANHDLHADDGWSLYLDVRMGLETAQVWAVTGELHDNYEAALMAQDDSLIPDLPCTSKATFYGGALAASCAAYVLRRFITGQPLDLIYSFALSDWAAVRI